MAHDEAERILRAIFEGVFQQPIDFTPTLNRDTFAAWDSLKHMEIIFAVESATGIEFSEQSIVAVRSAGDLLAHMVTSHAT